MTNILLAAGVVIVLLAANVVMLISVLHRTRQRKGPYPKFFATANTSIRREAIKVLEALNTSVGKDTWARGHGPSGRHVRAKSAAARSSS